MTQPINAERIILVTGATGNQGSAIARQLLQRGKFKVRAMVRDQNKPTAQALKQAGAGLVQGDFNDRTSLVDAVSQKENRALQGVYGIFSIQDFREGAEAEIRHGEAIADAARAAGIEHFVYSSVGSAEHNTGIPHFDSKFQVEEYIRSLKLPYTILRQVFFFYGEPTDFESYLRVGEASLKGNRNWTKPTEIASGVETKAAAT